MNERLKTVLLWALCLLLLVQVGNIWFQVPKVKKGASSQENFESSRLKEDLLGPRKVIIHFSDRDHTVLYKTHAYWSIVYKGLNQVYGGHKDSKDAKALTEDAYLDKIKAGPMVSLCFSGVLDHGNWAQLLGLDISHLTKEIQGKLLGLDVALDGSSLIFTTDRGHYLVPMTIHTIGKLKERVGQIYDSRRYRNYTSFNERYGIDNLVFVPKITTQPPQTIPLENKLSSLASSVQNSLARRFLRENIDYIREITEKDAVTYVYDQKVLRLSKSGWLSYSDSEKSPNLDVGLVPSLNTALDFITSRTGISGSLYLKEAQDLSNDQGSNFLFSFGMVTNDRRVYRQGKDNYLAKILVNRGKVVKMDLLYQRPQETDLVRPMEIARESLSPEDMIQMNLSLLAPEAKNLKEALNQVDYIDAAYLEVEREEGKKELLPVWSLSLGGRAYLLDMKTGKILKGGQDGLV